MTMLLDFVPDALVEEEEGALRRWAGGAASKRRRESVLGVVSSSDGLRLLRANSEKTGLTGEDLTVVKQDGKGRELSGWLCRASIDVLRFFRMLVLRVPLQVTRLGSPERTCPRSLSHECKRQNWDPGLFVASCVLRYL